VRGISISRSPMAVKNLCETFFADISLRAVTLDDLSRYRASWKTANITALRKIQRLRGFFSFRIARGWVEKNPAQGLTLPKEHHLPTLPFSEGEWKNPLGAQSLS
jgi:site-specific recombinase XerD